MTRPGSLVAKWKRCRPRMLATALLRATLGANAAMGSLTPENAPPQSPPPVESATAPGDTSRASSISGRADVAFEGLLAPDVTLTESSIASLQRWPHAELKATLTGQTFGFDYRPASFDFLGHDSRRDESRLAAHLAAQFNANERWRWLASAGAYEGFTDHRNAWLDEYYRQQFSGLDGFGDRYRRPAPGGINASTGFRWEYLPASGFLQVDAGYLHDRIAPGYEIDFEGLRRGRERLDSWTLHVGGENVLTRRLRLLNELRVTTTSGRETRWNLQSSANLALGERWIARAFAGHARERPGFEATYTGLTLECQFDGDWSLGVTGRFYTDTGEIESALFSSAAPGLRAWQTGLTVRKSWDNHSLRIHAAPYFTRYEPTGLGTAFFRNLYAARSWLQIQAAYSFTY